MDTASIQNRVAIKEALGQSDAFLAMQERLSRVASVERPVLLIGERGTGKELAASRIHYLSGRWQNAFITLNCAALSPSLLESELFGHEAGAFTGATSQRKGRFEMAHEGTLFLDEIGTMPMVVQEKILRAIEYNTFERVGGSSPIQVDVRIVAATNADLPALAAAGDFKKDLLDRLSFEVISLPPLRERKEDIPLLAAYFAAQMVVELGLKNTPSFSDEVIDQLVRYAWPGNVRELKNVIERAVYQCETDTICGITFDPFSDFSKNIHNQTAMQDGSTKLNSTTVDLHVPLHKAIKELERDYLQKALQKALFNQKKAAEILGMTYHQFRGLYKKYKDIIILKTI